MQAKASTLLVLATRNRHKAGEIRTILGENYQYRTLEDFPGAPGVVEDALTFGGNAAKKAMELARWLAAGISNLKFEISNPAFVLADDSGLEVDVLDGAPGVHSARFAFLDAGLRHGNAPDDANNAKLLRLLHDVPPGRRSARFRCVIALAPILPPEPHNASPVCSADELEFKVQLHEGVCEGQIAFEPKGRGGFGYDPLFVPEGFDASFAELGEDVKNRISHRSKSLQALKAGLMT